MRNPVGSGRVPQGIIKQSDDLAGNGVEIPNAPERRVAPVNRGNFKFPEGKPTARKVKILGDDQDVVEMVLLKEAHRILRGIPSGETVVVLVMLAAGRPAFSK